MIYICVLLIAQSMMFVSYITISAIFFSFVDFVLQLKYMWFSTVFSNWWYLYHRWYMEGSFMVTTNYFWINSYFVQLNFGNVNYITKIVLNVFMWNEYNKVFMKLNGKSTNYIWVMSSVPCGSCNCLVHDVGMRKRRLKGTGLIECCSNMCLIWAKVWPKVYSNSFIQIVSVFQITTFFCVFWLVVHLASQHIPCPFNKIFVPCFLNICTVYHNLTF